MVILGSVASKSPAKARFQAVAEANQAKITVAESIKNGPLAEPRNLSSLLEARFASGAGMAWSHLKPPGISTANA